MPKKVLDLDLERLPDRLDGLAGYDYVWALLRLRGCPIGHLVVDVVDGGVDGAALRAAASRLAGPPLLRTWTESVVGRPTPPTAPRATIAVCTRDRPDDLDACLTALGRLPDRGQDVLVVDNSPATEATRTLVARRFPSVRYVCEPLPGLNRARNRALREATHPIVAFVDDDAVVDPEWLDHLLAPFEDPLVLCATGLVLPYELETPAQEHFEQFFGFSRRGYERRTFSRSLHDPLNVGGAGAGANMALRRDLPPEMGLFDPALDAGTPTRSGGDHDLFARILLAGFRIVYEPRALVWHRHRRTWPELQAAVYGYGVGAYAWFTRGVVVEREPGYLGLAAKWFVHEQARTLWRSLRRRHGAPSLSLVVRELAGCLAGPMAYARSRRRVRAQEASR